MLGGKACWGGRGIGVYAAHDVFALVEAGAHELGSAALRHQFQISRHGFQIAFQDGPLVIPLGDLGTVAVGGGMEGFLIGVVGRLQLGKAGDLGRPGFGEARVVAQGGDDLAGLGVEIRLAQIGKGDDEFGLHESILLKTKTIVLAIAAVMRP